jgi:glucose-6-phosphate isomerase
MKSLRFRYTDCSRVPAHEMNMLHKKLEPEIKRLQHAATKQYATPYASINLMNDEQMLLRLQAVIQEKQQLKPTIMVVVGIGGSNLGAMAVHHALQGMSYNETNPQLKVYWADTVDADHIYRISEQMEHALQANEHVLITIISKSGSTTETAANAQVLLALLKKYHPHDYSRFVVAITDNLSPLWHIAQNEGWVTLEIPRLVGGRYCVLSAAGLFPLGMLGIDYEQLLQGARFLMPELLDHSFEKNPAALSAAILAYWYTQGVRIHDTFLFSVSCESLGKWYRQLMGESIGKEYNNKGEQVHVGITPTVSIGSTDLHSVGQLYLGGPRNTITTFITLDRVKHDTLVPSMSEYTSLTESIQDKPLSMIMNAIVQGVQKAYQKQALPFMTISLPEKSAFYVGQLLQCKMLEIMYLGYLLDINPFDQPQVELYKQETREILSHE